MTPTELRSARRALGLTQEQLAHLLRLSDHPGKSMTTGARTVQRWESGQVRVPGPVAVLLEWLAWGRRPM